MENTIKAIFIQNIKEAFKVYGIEGTEDKLKELLTGEVRVKALLIYNQILNKEV